MKALLVIPAALAAMWALPAVAQSFAGGPPPPRTIIVSGESNQQVAPNQAILTMSLVSHNPDLEAAKHENDEMVNRLVAISRDLNIPRDKVATSNVYISPEYNYNQKENKSERVGYIVNRTLRVTMDSLDVHEKLLSAIVAAKIDQINGIEFRLSDPETFASPLRVKAFENAKAKAEALAKASGDKLGRVLNITAADTTTPIGAPPSPMVMNAFRASASEATAPSLPGMVELHEAVTVTFTLE